MSQGLALPSSPSAWEDEAKEQDITFSDSIHDDNLTFSSASKMHDSQFLLLRVLWDKGTNSLISEMQTLFGLEQVTAAAKALDKASGWQKYLDCLPSKKERRTTKPLMLGHFTQVHWKQLVINTLNPTKTAEDDIYAAGSLTPGRKTQGRLRERPPNIQGMYAELSSSSSSIDGPPSQHSKHSNYSTSSEALGNNVVASIAKDEQLVTTYREALLTAISMDAFPNGLQHHHSIVRRTFQFGELFTASVDGTDEDLHDSSIVKAIYEDKRHHRSRKNKVIRQQETGEMVCWIASDDRKQHGVTHYYQTQSKVSVSNDKHQVHNHYVRILISQNHDELYVTFATYDDRYRAYLKGKTSLRSLERDTDERIFMKMKEYGPFSISKKADMRAFGICYVTLLLQWRDSHLIEVMNALAFDDKVHSSHDSSTDRRAGRRADESPSSLTDESRSHGRREPSAHVSADGSRHGFDRRGRSRHDTSVSSSAERPVAVQSHRRSEESRGRSRHEASVDSSAGGRVTGSPVRHATDERSVHSEVSSSDSSPLRQLIAKRRQQEQSRRPHSED